MILVDVLKNLRTIWAGYVSETVPLQAAPTATQTLPIAVYTIISQEPVYKGDFLAEVYLQIAIYAKKLEDLISLEHKVLQSFGGGGLDIGNPGESAYVQLVMQRPAVWLEESGSWQGISELKVTYYPSKEV